MTRGRRIQAQLVFGSDPEDREPVRPGRETAEHRDADTAVGRGTRCPRTGYLRLGYWTAEGTHPLLHPHDPGRHDSLRSLLRQEAG